MCVQPSITYTCLISSLSGSSIEEAGLTADQASASG